MALVAGETSMFPFEKITSFLVIELIRVPLDQQEIWAVMIGMAAYTFLAGSGTDVIRGVQSALGSYSRSDVGVATDALELGLSATDLMAVGAVQGAVKKLMLSRQWARRNLPPRGSSEHAQQNQRSEDTDQTKLGLRCDREAQAGGSRINLDGTALFLISSKIQQTSFAPQGMVRRFTLPSTRLPASKSIRALLEKTVTGRAQGLGF